VAGTWTAAITRAVSVPGRELIAANFVPHHVTHNIWVIEISNIVRLKMR
jgi:hypothetical protein